MPTKNLKIAYIHRTSFPSTEANTFDSIWSAAALSEKVDTTFFVPRLKSSLSKLREYYEIVGSHLKLRSMHLNLIPDRLLLRFPSTYENLLSFYLHFHPKWAGFRGQKVLYVREPKELLYWGEKRANRKWMKDWILCYEAHDTLGLDPSFFLEVVSGNSPTNRTPIERRTLAAAQNFDLMICNTQTLADDMRDWSNGLLKPHVITLASPLPRLERIPEIKFGENITVGYIGTIDKYRGVDILLDAMKYLPEKIHLMIVGRFRIEQGVDPDWINKYNNDPQMMNRIEIRLVDQINDVAAEIDKCDIVVQTASHDVIDSRYAAPLKSYGYMMRGKPIIAGNVTSHHELFVDGQSAALYDLDPKSLAECIMNLVNNVDLANKLAVNAWKQSSHYTFSRKVTDLLSLINFHIMENR